MPLWQRPRSFLCSWAVASLEVVAVATVADAVILVTGIAWQFVARSSERAQVICACTRPAQAFVDSRGSALPARRHGCRDAQALDRGEFRTIGSVAMWRYCVVGCSHFPLTCLGASGLLAGGVAGALLLSEKNSLCPKPLWLKTTAARCGLL